MASYVTSAIVRVAQESSCSHTEEFVADEIRQSMVVGPYNYSSNVLLCESMKRWFNMSRLSLRPYLCFVYTVHVMKLNTYLLN